MKSMTITYEAWLQTVDKWIRRYLLKTSHSHYFIHYYAEPDCGFCEAMLELVVYDFQNKDCIQFCPAAPDICLNYYNPDFTTIRQIADDPYFSIELKIQAILEILHWLHDFGALAHWR